MVGSIEEMLHSYTGSVDNLQPKHAQEDEQIPSLTIDNLTDTFNDQSLKGSPNL